MGLLMALFALEILNASRSDVFENVALQKNDNCLLTLEPQISPLPNAKGVDLFWTRDVQILSLQGDNEYPILETSYSVNKISAHHKQRVAINHILNFFLVLLKTFGGAAGLAILFLV